MKRENEKYLVKYEIYVDGRKLGVLWDSARTQKEILRLRGLMGVAVKGPFYEN